MYHANNEKQKTILDGRNRTTNPRKDQNAQRKRNLQILRNVGSEHHQTSRDKRKKNLISISGERGNNSKSKYTAEIVSKR